MTEDKTLLTNARSLSASEWIPVNGTGFPNYSDFEFVQNCTDVVAIPNCIPATKGDVLALLRRFSRRDGLECLFSFATIKKNVSCSEEDLYQVLDNLTAKGEILRLGDGYRLN